VATWEIQNTYLLDADLINYFMGSPFSFLKVDGQEYIALVHYKHLFMDNYTLEVFPDNKLMVKLLDFNLQEVKTMALNIETRYPDAGQYVIPMAEFGLFYRDPRFRDRSRKRQIFRKRKGTGNNRFWRVDRISGTLKYATSS